MAGSDAERADRRTFLQRYARVGRRALRRLEGRADGATTGQR